MRERIEGGAAEDEFVAKARVYVSMVDNPGTLPDPAPELPDPNDLDNPTNRPGRCAHAFAFGLAGASTCPDSSNEPQICCHKAINSHVACHHQPPTIALAAAWTCLC